MTTEIFLPHPRHPNTLVGTLGTIKTTTIVPIGRVRLQFIDKKGYPKCGIKRNGKATSEYVHRLVAETHIPNPLKLRDVNHINHNKADNRVANLGWVTHQDNIQKARVFHGNWTTGEKIRKPVVATPVGGGAPVRWPSARAWAKQSGDVRRVSNVSHAINGGTTAYGYRWAFDTTYINPTTITTPAASEPESLGGP